MDTIHKLVFRLGIRSTYQGFRYLTYALYLCQQNEDISICI